MSENKKTYVLKLVKDGKTVGYDAGVLSISSTLESANHYYDRSAALYGASKITGYQVEILCVHVAYLVLSSEKLK